MFGWKINAYNMYLADLFWYGNRSRTHDSVFELRGHTSLKHVTSA